MRLQSSALRSNAPGIAHHFTIHQVLLGVYSFSPCNRINVKFSFVRFNSEKKSHSQWIISLPKYHALHSSFLLAYGILLIYRRAHELNISILYNRCTTVAVTLRRIHNIQNKRDSFSSSPMYRIITKGRENKKTSKKMVLMNVWTTPLSINIYENWLWHKSVCVAARRSVKERILFSHTALFAMELICTFTGQFESEVVIIAYCSWNCIAFVTTPFKAYWPIIGHQYHVLPCPLLHGWLL